MNEIHVLCALENDDINCRLILCVVTLVDYQRPEHYTHNVEERRGEERGGTKKMEKQEKEFNDKRN